MKRWTGRRKVLRAVIVIVLAMAFFTACGKEETGIEYGIDGYVYQAEALREGESSQMQLLKAYDGFLYYIDGSSFYRLQIGDAVDFSKQELLPAPDSTEDYAVGPDGAVYCMSIDRAMTSSFLNNATGCTLRRLGAEAEGGWTVSMPGVKPAAQYGKSSLETDGAGRLFFLTETGIRCIGEGGKTASTISIENFRGDGQWTDEALVRGEAGKVYYRCSLGTYEIKGDGEFRLEKIADISGYLCGSEYGLLCYGRDGVLSQYRSGESAWAPVLRWTDSGVAVRLMNTDNVAQLDEGRFLALLDGTGFTQNLYLMTRKALSELPKKERLVLAAEFPPEDLVYWVSKFNQESDRYNIAIDYHTENDGNARLNASLLSRNPPDLVLADGLDVAGYAEKQTFEDLLPYVEKSGILKKEDFFEEILEGYTIGGRLVCIPGGFGFFTIIGRASQVGKESGWTMDSVMPLVEQYADMRLLNYGKSNMLGAIVNTLCDRYILGQFIDWESGECSFDSEEFLRFMEWLRTYLTGFHARYGEDYEYYGEENLLFIAPIDSLSALARIERSIGEKATVIGIPTPDGSPYVSVIKSNALCIPARSAHKEGAWAFVEYFLSQEEISGLGFPSRRDIFQRNLEEEMTPEYVLDENGNIAYGYTWGMPMTQENYHPVLNAKAWYTDSMGNTEVLYDYMSQEQADQLTALFDMADFTPARSTDSKVLDVVLEELEEYVNGNREAGDVAKNIQNRVKNLVDEQAK